MENNDNIKTMGKRIIEIVVLILLAALLILLVFKFAAPISHLEDDGLVIGFIGVLATFIVIGNFAQTSHIRETIENEQANFEKNINQDITQLLTDIESLKSKNTEHEEGINQHATKLNLLIKSSEQTNKDLQKLTEEFDKQNLTSVPINRNDLACFLSLFVGRGNDVSKAMHLYGKMTDFNSQYNIVLNDGSRHFAKLLYEDRQVLVLLPKDKKVTLENVKMISGVPCEPNKIQFAYKLLTNISFEDEKTSLEEHTIKTADESEHKE